MPQNPEWTRAEIQFADEAAASLGMAREDILHNFLPLTRQTQANEQGMDVERWVAVMFAIERHQDAVDAAAAGPEEGEEAYALAAAVIEAARAVQDIAAGREPLPQADAHHPA